MKSKDIDITPLLRAVARLEEIVAIQIQQPNDEIIRDAAIQRFEFTYELTFKMVKRYLRAISENSNTDVEVSFQETIRQGCKYHLLGSELEQWMHFREMRNKSSHAYDEKLAQEVGSQIPEFLVEAQVVASRLTQAIAT